jgi:hypothetical protein
MPLIRIEYDCYSWNWWNLYELDRSGRIICRSEYKGLSTNITANIISDITEPGTNKNELTYGCSDNYTLTISPSGGALELYRVVPLLYSTSMAPIMLY